MRDPTRGGVATSLNELARDCGLGVVLFEETIPVRDAVRGACELLGLDPLHIANEGQFLAVVAARVMPTAALAALGHGAARPYLPGTCEPNPRSVSARRDDVLQVGHGTAELGVVSR